MGPRDDGHDRLDLGGGARPVDHDEVRREDTEQDGGVPLSPPGLDDRFGVCATHGEVEAAVVGTVDVPELGVVSVRSECLDRPVGVALFQVKGAWPARRWDWSPRRRVAARSCAATVSPEAQ